LERRARHKHLHLKLKKEVKVSVPVSTPASVSSPAPNSIPNSVSSAPVSEDSQSPIDKKNVDDVAKPVIDESFSSKKAIDDDILNHEAEEIHVTSASGEVDSMTALRIKRARNRIWADLRDGIDLKALARMDGKAARDEVKTAVEEIARFRNLDLTPMEMAQIAKECGDDMLGYGPLETLLAEDGIADIMINGPDVVYVERKGKIQKTDITFRDNQHLVTICQRIVGAIGRRVDESSPICDARLPDGSRVNVIIPPLAVDGACMTIRKFTKDKLTLEKLLEFGRDDPRAVPS
jgi:pilus assembly protein CpaF